MKDTRPEFIVGNVLDVLANDFEDDSIDLVCTSPPYWGLRDYGSGTDAIWGGDGECVHDFTESERLSSQGSFNVESAKVGATKAGVQRFVIKEGICHLCGAWKGQLGLEPTWQLYVQHMVEISREIKRVLKPTGSYYLVLGDTYAGSWGDSGHRPERDGIAGTQRAKRTKFLERKGHPQMSRPPSSRTGYDNITKPKQKLLIPYRVAIALQEDGWICRNDITWRKPNAMPSSVKDRLTCTTERIFHFVKNAKGYFYDLDAIRAPHQYDGRKVLTAKRQKTDCYRDGIERWPNPAGKNPGDAVEYDGKFTGMGKDAEKFGSPRARSQRIGKKFRIGDGYRQGMNRDPDDIVILRKHDIKQSDIAEYLKRYTKAKETELDSVFGEHRWRHWTRTDASGACLPAPHAWLKLKEILGFDDRYDKMMTETITKTSEVAEHPYGKNPGDYWSINTQPFPQAHFAVFPEALIEPIIKSSCPPDGVVLDPFCGSGTTNLVAMKLGRASIGIDVSETYIKMAKKRCGVDVPSLFDFPED